MKKTSVYLTEEEAQRLRALALSTGRSQADLVREGIRSVLARKQQRPKFRSMGLGVGTGEKRPRWDSNDLADRRLGRR